MTAGQGQVRAVESAADGLAMPARLVAVVAIVVTAVLSVLDGAMLNVALPGLSTELSISSPQAVWIVNAYQLTTVVCLLPVVVLADRHGYALVFRLGALVYTAAALACALADGFHALLAARVAQGLGSAGIMGCSSALLRATYPARLFGTGVGINTTSVTFAAAAGPSLGALILALSGDWRWLFLLELPFGVIACACTFALPGLPRHSRSLKAHSVLLNMVALGAGIVGLGMLAERPASGLGLLALTALAWWLWVRAERGVETPLLPIDLFRIDRFRFAIAASASMFGAQAGALIALPFYFHDAWGMDVLRTGGLLTVWPICATVMSTQAIRLARRFSVAALCGAGALLLIAGLAWILLVPPGGAGLRLLPGLIAGGLAVGLFQAPNMHDMLSAAPRARSGAAGSVQAIARVGGSALGASLAGVCFGLFGGHGSAVALVSAGGLASAALAVNLARRRLFRQRA